MAKRKRSWTKRLPSKFTSAKKKKTSNGRGPAYVGLGSNLGNRKKNLQYAVREIRRVGRIVAVSPFHETEPVGFEQQPRFLNAVVKIVTARSPADLLATVQDIERRLGRTPTFRNGPRVIDIDLLDVRGERVASTKLTLPHPRIHQRRFVLEPLSEIAPRWKHPRLGKTARKLLEELES